MKVFVDCDVLLDVGLGREPFCQASGAVLDYLANFTGSGFIAWHSIANFYYLTSKSASKAQRQQFLMELSGFLTIVPASNNELLQAIGLDFNDFEDAMQCACALACRADVIVTRNISDYRQSPVKVQTPEQFMTECGSA